MCGNGVRICDKEVHFYLILFSVSHTQLAYFRSQVQEFPFDLGTTQQVPAILVTWTSCFIHP